MAAAPIAASNLILSLPPSDAAVLSTNTTTLAAPLYLAGGVKPTSGTGFRTVNLNSYFCPPRSFCPVWMAILSIGRRFDASPPVPLSHCADLPNTAVALPSSLPFSRKTALNTNNLPVDGKVLRGSWRRRRNFCVALLYASTFMISRYPDAQFLSEQTSM